MLYNALHIYIFIQDSEVKIEVKKGVKKGVIKGKNEPVAYYGVSTYDYFYKL